MSWRTRSVSSNPPERMAMSRRIVIPDADMRKRRVFTVRSNSATRNASLVSITGLIRAR